jgi:alkanesulfonate monooxygenase SsuD/methylene tetrahydromethanopterin reductase-like flavin-dependent oxidoreductase (luciferase family)
MRLPCLMESLRWIWEFLFPFRNPAQWHAPITSLYDEHIAEAVLAEELGYDHVWTTEHHFYDDACSPSLLPILAAIAQRTIRIRLGTFIIILPLHHPVRVAEDAATVDIPSKGRLELEVGQGYVVSEFESFKVPRKERASRLEEGIELIRRCFTEESPTRVAFSPYPFDARPFKVQLRIKALPAARFDGVHDFRKNYFRARNDWVEFELV